MFWLAANVTRQPFGFVDAFAGGVVPVPEIAKDPRIIELLPLESPNPPPPTAFSVDDVLFSQLTDSPVPAVGPAV